MSLQVYSLNRADSEWEEAALDPFYRQRSWAEIKSFVWAFAESPWQRQEPRPPKDYCSLLTTRAPLFWGKPPSQSPSEYQQLNPLTFSIVSQQPVCLLHPTVEMMVQLQKNKKIKCNRIGGKRTESMTESMETHCPAFSNIVFRGEYLLRLLLSGFRAWL